MRSCRRGARRQRCRRTHSQRPPPPCPSHSRPASLPLSPSPSSSPSHAPLILSLTCPSHPPPPPLALVRRYAIAAVHAATGGRRAALRRACDQLERHANERHAARVLSGVGVGANVLRAFGTIARASEQWRWRAAQERVAQAFRWQSAIRLGLSRLRSAAYYSVLLTYVAPPHALGGPSIRLPFAFH